MNSTLRTAVVGVSGYAGGELARLLLGHPRLANTPPIFLGRVGSPDTHPVALTDLHPELSGLPFADELQVSAFD
ncbi:MAG: N-acetyl-gamma-glutamyl-phosphate reductase, partial [Acidobacteriota bacterium]|nr:N-acetyl-gamma-glutamyl-phosphate reductase [Acidobacteriota bacterium]